MLILVSQQKSTGTFPGVTRFSIHFSVLLAKIFKLCYSKRGYFIEALRWMFHPLLRIEETRRFLFLGISKISTWETGGGLVMEVV